VKKQFLVEKVNIVFFSHVLWNSDGKRVISRVVKVLIYYFSNRYNILAQKFYITSNVRNQ